MTVQKHYYSNRKDDVSKKLGDEVMRELDELNILFDEEQRRLGHFLIIHKPNEDSDKSHPHKPVAGWTPSRIAQLTNWFTSAHLQALCRAKKIDCYKIANQNSIYLITPRGIDEIYERYLRKEKR